MWTIRTEQVAELERAYRAQQAARMKEHARSFFADALRDIDDAALGRFMQRTVAEAARLGLDRLPDVLLYMNLSLTFGEGFLGRPELRWLRDRLFDPEIESPRERLRRAYDEAQRREESSGA